MRTGNTKLFLLAPIMLSMGMLNTAFADSPWIYQFVRASSYSCKIDARNEVHFRGAGEIFINAQKKLVRYKGLANVHDDMYAIDSEKLTITEILYQNSKEIHFAGITDISGLNFLGRIELRDGKSKVDIRVFLQNGDLFHRFGSGDEKEALEIYNKFPKIQFGKY